MKDNYNGEIMGLSVGRVRLEKYNPKWKEEFNKEKENLIYLFGNVAKKIEHIGSTAVVGISAKPIIDIAVGLQNLHDFEEVREKFTSNINYSIKENSQEGEILIRKGPEENRTHFIHVMEIESQRYKDTIRYRDILNSRSEVLKEYEKLKKKLAKEYPNDRKMYTKLKSEFIKKVLNDE